MDMLVSDYSFNGLTKQIMADTNLKKRAAQDTALYLLEKIPNQVYTSDWARICIYSYTPEKFIKSFYEVIKEQHVPENKRLITIAEMLNNTEDYGIVITNSTEEKTIVIILLGYDVLDCVI